MPLSSEKAREISFKRWGDFATRYPWTAMQKDHDEGMFLQDLRKKYHIARNTLEKAIEHEFFKKKKNKNNIKRPPFAHWRNRKNGRPTQI